MKYLSKSNKEYLFKILRPYRPFVILFFVVSFVSSIFEGFSISMLVPLLSSLQGVQDYDQLPKFLQIIAKLFSKYSLEKQILLSIGFALTAMILKNLFFGISINLGNLLSGKVVADLRFKAFDMLMKVGLEFYNNTAAGHLIEKVLNDTKTLQSLITTSIDFVVNSTTFIVLVALMFVFSWELSLISLFLAILIALAISFYIKSFSKLGRKTAESARELSALLLESINGINVIKSFVREDHTSKLLKETAESVRKNEFKLSYRNNSIRIITEVLGIVAITFLFLLSMIRTGFDNKLLITQLIPFVYIITRLIPSVKTLNYARGVIVSNLPYLNLVYDLLRLDNKPIIQDGYKPFSGLEKGISFESVAFSYGGDDKFALHDASFYIPKGKTTAIVGESGAGKSTIISLLLRFYDPQKGIILIDAEPLRNFKISSYRKILGIVSQDAFIFNDTVKNNIDFGSLNTYPDDIVIEAARKANAHQFIMELPDGYDTILGDRGVRLSGGQRQRISIARAILLNPEILILDEATSSLDTRTEKLIHNAISDLTRNRTVIIIAHRLSTIQRADQIIVLKTGRVVEIGGEMDLINIKGEYYSFKEASK
jgi:subfamily B ATP-binding cassette protein MsbA